MYLHDLLGWVENTLTQKKAVLGTSYHQVHRNPFMIM